MMLKTLIFIFSFVPFLVKSQFVDSTKKNYKTYYYENGNLSSEGTLLNGKPDHYWITYYPNQLRKSEGNRKNFLLDSTWKFYNKKGNIQNKINYLDGKKNGVYQHFDDDCVLIKEENYTFDVIDGVSKIFYSDSSLSLIKKTIPYVDGRKEGIGYEYTIDGLITAITKYKKNFIVFIEQINKTDDDGLKQGVWKEYFANKRLKTEERYKNDLLNGYVKEYNAQGKLKSATLYLNGKLQSDEKNIADFDVNTIYYSDGTTKSTSVVNKAGKKDGVSTFYGENGRVVATEIYRNGYLLKKGIIDKKGVLQGVWEEFYLNGKIKSKGEYKNGKKYSRWEYYFTTGKIEQKGSYDSNGQYTGEWIWYYDNGNVLRREEFRKGIEDGELAEYTIDGIVITQGEFFDGEKEGEWFYELNDHQEKGKYRYSQRNGYWEHRFPGGKISFKGNYIDGIPEGKHKYYNEKGQLTKEEVYSFGQKDGKWRWLDDFGNETTTITYKDDVEIRIDGQKIKYNKE
jgi:antitoxin component YwqK of YwqJK toxin-antitoxin module